VQAIVRQQQRVPNGIPVHYAHRHLAQTSPYRFVQQHAGDFFAEVEFAAGADLSRFVK
jgi:hypothetical protein